MTLLRTTLLRRWTRMNRGAAFNGPGALSLDTGFVGRPGCVCASLGSSLCVELFNLAGTLIFLSSWSGGINLRSPKLHPSLPSARRSLRLRKRKAALPGMVLLLPSSCNLYAKTLLRRPWDLRCDRRPSSTRNTLVWSLVPSKTVRPD